MWLISVSVAHCEDALPKTHCSRALQGQQPSVERLLSLHTMLTGSATELRQPINLEQQLIQTTGSDSEVAASMVQLLQVPPLLCLVSAGQQLQPRCMRQGVIWNRVILRCAVVLCCHAALLLIDILA